MILDDFGKNPHNLQGVRRQVAPALNKNQMTESLDKKMDSVSLSDRIRLNASKTF